MNKSETTSTTKAKNQEFKHSQIIMVKCIN